MKKINIHLQTLPIGTPADTRLFLAGNCNKWQPDDKKFQFKAKGNGTYTLTVKTELDVLEFKITRGNWSAAEGNINGHVRPNRVFKPGLKENDIWLHVASWTDLYQDRQKENVVLLHPDFQIPQLKRNRRIWAFLPPDYWKNPEKRYPVVYMQDGQNLFDNPDAIFGSWNIDKAINRLFVQSPAADQPTPIIIGIENGGIYRTDEYSIWKNSEYGGGEGSAYLDFICNSLKPFVDEHLRTLPAREHTGIMGSSMGGFISLSGVLMHPEIFGMAGVFSPSLWFSREVFELARKGNPGFPVRILLMAGQQESEDMVSDMLDLYEILLDAGHDDQMLHYDLHSDGMHSEWFWSREFEHALRWLFGELPGHNHDVITDESIEFQLDPAQKELIINVSENVIDPNLEIRDYCHDRNFSHPLRHTGNRVSYAAWEECIFSIRLTSEGDLIFSRRVHLNQLQEVTATQKSRKKAAASSQKTVETK